ncbi:hypothetical protein [Haloactinomyces albus]|uniref:Uncharacterized protein n=1 Tax=Haloactinomyces albus TaxID=1352928 RepID=A0AAE3ZCG8_9ACTN|nr:hypothetical protein [Haloactinomyces albus]MDR7302388.1 hypothetical protein [Haloactinomyces albus]
MLGFWVQVVLVALVVGALGAVAVLAWCGRRTDLRGTEEHEHVLVHGERVRGGQPLSRSGRDTPSRGPERDVWAVPLHRCEQAVCRAGRVVESVSSVRTRHRLSGVVHRMDAELSNVRALVELGRSLDADSARAVTTGTTEQTGQTGQTEPGAVAARVHRQLVETAERFGAVTDAVLELVLELVTHSDPSGLDEQVTRLRDEFPLLRPMSVILGPNSGNRATPSLLDTPV